MVSIEPAQEILIGLPRPTGMLDGDHSGNQTKNLGRSALRLQDNFLVGNELLRRGSNRPFAHHGNLWNFQRQLIRIVSADQRGDTDQCEDKEALRAIVHSAINSILYPWWPSSACHASHPSRLPAHRPLSGFPILSP